MPFFFNKLNLNVRCLFVVFSWSAKFSVNQLIIWMTQRGFNSLVLFLKGNDSMFVGGDRAVSDNSLHK